MQLHAHIANMQVEHSRTANTYTTHTYTQNNHIHIRILYIYIYMRMGTRLQYDLCSHVYSHYPSTAKGSLLPPLWLKYHCRSPEKTIANAEAAHLLFVVVVENRLLLYQQRTHTYRRESPIHRLSAVGLLRSLRAGSRGPYR